MRIRTILAALAVSIALAPAIAGAASQQAYTFMNIAYDNCNDIELEFAGAITNANYTGGPGGTQFPSVSGLGTSHVILSGATMSNPGYSQYNFTCSANPFPGLQHCRATNNGSIIGLLRADPL